MNRGETPREKEDYFEDISKQTEYAIKKFYTPKPEKTAPRYFYPRHTPEGVEERMGALYIEISAAQLDREAFQREKKSLMQQIIDAEKRKNE